MARLPKPNASPSELASFSQTAWDDQDAFVGFWAERWKRSIDFIRSLHWRALLETDIGKLPSWKRYPIVNYTLAFYSDYLAQFLQSRTRYSAVPASPDPADISSAELADNVLRYTWDKVEMDYKKIDLAAWLAATGNADLRVYWNKDTGDMIPLAKPIMLPNGQQGMIPINPKTMQPDMTMQQPVMVDAGEIGVEVVAPQLVRHGLKRSQGTMIGRLITYDEAADLYGDKVAENLSYGGFRPGALANDMLSVYTNTGMPKPEDSALIIEHHLPRSSRNPEGLWWTASGRTLVTSPQPLPAREIGLVHFRWVPLPGHPTMGLTPIYDMTFSNKAYDEMLARILEWLNKVVPKLVRQSGDGLKYGEFTDEPGQEVTVQPGTQPSFIEPPGPPEHFFKIKQDISEDMANVGGYRFRRDEQVPAGESTSRMRQPLHTKNEGEVVALALLNSAPAWKKLGYILLDFAAKYYDEPRILSVVGKDRTYQWREFSGQDLKNLTATIHVDEKSLYTWNRQSMRDTVIGLMQSEAAKVLFVDASGNFDKERVDAAMESAGIDVSPDTLDPDIMEARNEINQIQYMQEGDEPLQAMPWQNNEVHLEEKQRIMKSLAFKGWPEHASKALLDNASQHEQAIAAAQKSQQQAMLDQEKALRDIRAQSETAQNIRTALGEVLAEALGTYLAKDDKKETKSK